jgi:hypothetical protein
MCGLRDIDSKQYNMGDFVKKITCHNSKTLSTKILAKQVYENIISPKELD